MDIESSRCIISPLEKVVVVRPTYVLFSLGTQTPEGQLNIHKNICPIKKFSGERRVIGNN